MERVKVLIERLAEQQRQNASPAQLLVTIQLLQNEVLGMQQKSVPVGAKVSVVMPSNGAIKMPAAQKAPAATIEEKQPQISKPVTLKEEPAPKQIPVEEPIFNIPEIAAHKPAVLPEVALKPRVSEPAYMPFDPVAETPTLLHHQPVAEMKKEVYALKMEDSAAEEEPLSLNDKLKQERTEVGQVLKEAPIKDLRKAVGINDKFLFVNELFRGDEAMYDRSIKTINGFHILPEAEYWINRELKVKLGWNDSKDVVQHFYHLVRRRFS